LGHLQKRREKADHFEWRTDDCERRTLEQSTGNQSEFEVPERFQAVAESEA